MKRILLFFLVLIAFVVKGSNDTFTLEDLAESAFLEDAFEAFNAILKNEPSSEFVWGLQFAISNKLKEVYAKNAADEAAAAASDGTTTTTTTTAAPANATDSNPLDMLSDLWEGVFTILPFLEEDEDVIIMDMALMLGLAVLPFILYLLTLCAAACCSRSYSRSFCSCCTWMLALCVLFSFCFLLSSMYISSGLREFYASMEHVSDYSHLVNDDDLSKYFWINETNQLYDTGLKYDPLSAASIDRFMDDWVYDFLMYIDVFFYVPFILALIIFIGKCNPENGCVCCCHGIANFCTMIFLIALFVVALLSRSVCESMTLDADVQAGLSIHPTDNSGRIFALFDMNLGFVAPFYKNCSDSTLASAVPGFVATHGLNPTEMLPLKTVGGVQCALQASKHFNTTGIPAAMRCPASVIDYYFESNQNSSASDTNTQALGLFGMKYMTKQKQLCSTLQTRDGDLYSTYIQDVESTICGELRPAFFGYSLLLSFFLSLAAICECFCICGCCGGSDDDGGDYDDLGDRGKTRRKKKKSRRCN